jgi:hypothetical protein
VNVKHWLRKIMSVEHFDEWLMGGVAVIVLQNLVILFQLVMVMTLIKEL